MLLNSLKSFQDFNASAYSKSQMADKVAMANPYYAGRMTCSRLEKALYFSGKTLWKKT